jgi:hypothetical protein
MYEDEIVEEIHRIRKEYSASLNHDLSAIVADLQAQKFDGEWEEVDLARKNKLQKRHNLLSRIDTFMNDKEKLIIRESNRYRILKIFYDHLADKPHSALNSRAVERDLVENGEMTEEDAYSAIVYLEDEGLLKAMTFDGVLITHKGRKEIEASIKNPDHNTEHFLSEAIKIVIGELTMKNNINNDLRGANIANFANQLEGNAQQVASDFSQNINQNIDEITKLIDSLRNMAREFPEEQNQAILLQLDDLQEDLATPQKQNSERIKNRFKTLVTILGSIAIGFAGTTDFTNNLLDLSEKVGVPIDVNLPQLIHNLSK